MNYLLFNGLSSSLKGEERAHEKTETLSARFPNIKEVNLIDLDHEAFIQNLKDDDSVIICGGDGTLNHFINAIHGIDLPCDFYLSCGGTGNDFAKDNDGKFDEDGLLKLNKLLHNLPIVEVNGKQYRFFNGTGLGVDGDTCNEANRQKSKGKKKVSYILIALKLILGRYKPTIARVEVNGQKLEIPDTFLATTMLGKYFGGGVMIAPNQNREDRKLLFIVAHVKGRIKTLLALNTVNSGKASKIPHILNSYETDEVHVKFSVPHALQIDGEVVENVTEYRAYTIK